MGKYEFVGENAWDSYEHTNKDTAVTLMVDEYVITADAVLSCLREAPGEFRVVIAGKLKGQDAIDMMLTLADAVERAGIKEFSYRLALELAARPHGKED